MFALRTVAASSNRMGARLLAARYVLVVGYGSTDSSGGFLPLTFKIFGIAPGQFHGNHYRGRRV
jgi:hypothetical protein